MAPSDLGDAGRVAWDEANALPWLSATDSGAAAHLARLEDERATLAAVLTELGPMLEEPIVTPRGEVVGMRRVANPMIGELRKLDSLLLAARDRLALAPAPKARLGVQVATMAEKARSRTSLTELAMEKYRGATAEAIEAAPGD